MNFSNLKKNENFWHELDVNKWKRKKIDQDNLSYWFRLYTRDCNWMEFFCIFNSQRHLDSLSKNHWHTQLKVSFVEEDDDSCCTLFIRHWHFINSQRVSFDLAIYNFHYFESRNSSEAIYGIHPFLLEIIERYAFLRSGTWSNNWRIFNVVSSFWVVFQLQIHFCHPIPLPRPECEAQVKGFTAPVFKKFKTNDEAEDFIRNRSNSALLLVSLSPIVWLDFDFNSNFSHSQTGWLNWRRQRSDH